jgi:hypothetical protein
MTPRSCPKYATCNAPVCPLDPCCTKAVHLAGEPVCRYLLASGKAGAAPYYAADPTFTAVLRLMPAVLARHGDIARRVASAAQSGIRGRHLRKKTATEAA